MWSLVQRGSARRLGANGTVTYALACITLLVGCSAGEGGDGFGSPASLGGNDAGVGTASGDDGIGTMDDGQSATGIGTIGGQTGSQDESGDGPTNPNEACNGLDDDDNGLVDDGLGTISCGVGACANSVPACDSGVPATCTPMPPGQEVCNALDDDCDGSVDEDTTGACSTACGPGSETCVGGVPECDAPLPQAEVCNYSDDDCDGALDEALVGCRVGVHRSANGATGEHFYTTSLAEAMSPGFVLEAQDYFAVYAAEHAGLIPFYRCIKGNGLHFYTASATCEGQVVEGVLGYVSASDVPEAGPLYRLSNGATGDHFYTTSEAERDGAVANYGYVYEAIACYVF